MSPETLDFEEPIVALLREIETLEKLPRTDARDREIALLRRRIETVRAATETAQERAETKGKSSDLWRCLFPYVEPKKRPVTAKVVGSSPIAPAK